MFVAALPILLLPVALAFKDARGATAALMTAGSFLVLGWLLSRIPTTREPRLREGMLVAATGWLVVPLLSILPFLYVERWRVLDAFFECMSAWTGTGVTIADVTVLSPTTLAWRSYMQWVGGLGVVVLTLAILARPGTGAYTLYASEAREEKLRPSVLSTVRTIWWIYLVLTIAAMLLLLAVRLPFWHAFNHALTGIGTAGMSITPENIGSYDPRVQWAFVPIMIAGALPFVAVYAAFRGQWRVFLRDEQVRAMFTLLLLAGAFLAWLLSRSQALDTPGAFRMVAFQVVSALTTTGFQTADIAAWDSTAKFGLMGFMLLGGAAGSTAGGIKLVRGVLLVKGAMWKLERSGLPHFAVTSFRFGGEKLDQREANEEFAEAAFIGVLWIVALFLTSVVVLAMLPEGVAVDDALFDVASLLGNVGLSTGVVNAGLPDPLKGVLLVAMWAARLEILPVLLLLRGLVPRLSNR